MFSNQPQLIDCLKNSLQQAALHRHRVFLVLAGDAGLQADAVVETFKQIASNVKPVSIMHVPDRHSNSDVADQINSLLGSEHQCLVFDAHVQFNERLFAASAATVVAGGLFVLNTPALDKWSLTCANETNDKHTIDSPTNPSQTNLSNSQHTPSAFIQRFINKLTHASSQCYPNILPVVPHSAMFIGSTKKNDQEQIKNKQDKHDGWRYEQQHLIQQLQTALKSKGSTVVVVQGDRGRGKSALIGQALADSGYSAASIKLTANRVSSCKVLRAHAGKHLEFVPVDVALQTRHDLLIVEEAGSLPIAVLLRLIKLSNKIVFATTVQGYEGAGRGFAIRFAKHLDALQTNWLKLTPKEPVRWSSDDPVEAFVNDALILDATTPSLSFVALENAAHQQSPTEICTPEISNPINAKQSVSTNNNLNQSYSDRLNAKDSRVRLVSKEQLLNDEAMLQRIFGLLISAHYQTTPSDLRHMLDEPQLHVYAQFCKGVMTGAVLLAIEGEIEVALHEPIIKKQRRIPDQILPQVFAQGSGLPAALSAAYARIVRIAVHPALHRQGFGRQFFTQLKNTLSASTILGASFGADEVSLSFWLSLGCRPVHYGFKTNPRSGQKAVCVLFNEEARNRQNIEFAAHVLYLNVQALTRVSRNSDPVLTLLSQATHECDSSIGADKLCANKPSVAESWALIKDYVKAYRSFADTVGLLITHNKIVAQPKVFEQVHAFLNNLDKLTPKQHRITDAELRQIIASQFGL